MKIEICRCRIISEIEGLFFVSVTQRLFQRLGLCSAFCLLEDLSSERSFCCLTVKQMRQKVEPLYFFFEVNYGKQRNQGPVFTT